MRILVMKKITWYTGAVLGPGRLIRAAADSTPKILDDYGDSVKVWSNWPKPMKEAEVSAEKKKRVRKKRPVKPAKK